MCDDVKPDADDVFVVKISNRGSVQNLQRAIEIVDDVLVTYPWSSELKQVKQLLENVWDGLTFSFSD